MKKIAILIIAAVMIVMGSSFRSHTTPRDDGRQCYQVKVTYDIVYETRTERYAVGSVVSSTIMYKDQVYFSNQCAISESQARDLAVQECYKSCSNNAGKYIQETSSGYVFEVRRVTKTEIVGTCGNC